MTDAGACGCLAAAEAPFHILVNNAGMNRPKPFSEVLEEDFDAVMTLNVRAAFFMAQAVTRRMAETGTPGSIIHVSSQIGHVGGLNRTVYCCSKWATEGLSKAMALDLAPHGIRANTLCPTFIETPMTRPFLADPEFRRAALAKIKLGRFGQVEDVIGGLIYLASDASVMVTGTSLLIDGGWTADQAVRVGSGPSGTWRRGDIDFPVAHDLGRIAPVDLRDAEGQRRAILSPEDAGDDVLARKLDAGDRPAVRGDSREDALEQKRDPETAFRAEAKPVRRTLQPGVKAAIAERAVLPDVEGGHASAGGFGQVERAAVRRHRHPVREEDLLRDDARAEGRMVGDEAAGPARLVLPKGEARVAERRSGEGRPSKPSATPGPARPTSSSSTRVTSSRDQALVRFRAEAHENWTS